MQEVVDQKSPELAPASHAREREQDQKCGRRLCVTVPVRPTIPEKSRGGLYCNSGRASLAESG